MTLCIHKRRRTSFFIALAILAIAAVLFAPWKQWIGAELKRRLEAQGFKNIELTVSRVGPSSITLENLSIGQDPPLSMNNVTLDYSIGDLLSGSAKALKLEGLALQVLRTKGGWGVAGLEPSKKGVKIPVSREELSSIPFNTARIENSTMHVASDVWQMDVPLQLMWQKTPTPSLTYEGQGLALKAQGLSLETGKATAGAELQDGAWEGRWEIKDIKITGAQASIPSLSGAGHLKALSERIEIDGEFLSADKSHRALFQTTYALSAPEQSALTLREVSMPWSGGVLSAQQVRIPFKSNAPIPINLKVQRVSADALLQQLTGKKATATGELSGILPIIWKPDGTVEVHQGALNSEGPGVIKIAPDALPSDNPQVALVRDVLTDFRYTALSVQAETAEGNNLSVRMTLEGSNPAAQGGRPVKLSVNLAGDVLGFVQQNLLWLTNPEKFLEQVK